MGKEKKKKKDHAILVFACYLRTVQYIAQAQ